MNTLAKLAQARDVLEEVRPMIKGYIITEETLSGRPQDESVLSRINAALSDEDLETVSLSDAERMAGALENIVLLIKANPCSTAAVAVQAQFIAEEAYCTYRAAHPKPT